MFRDYEKIIDGSRQFRKSQTTANLVVSCISFIFISFFLFSITIAESEPFTITEKTIYGFSENVVFVNVTENTDKDQIINISNIFTQHELTERINYSEVLILQEHLVDIYGLFNESQGKYKTFELIFWNETVWVYNETSGLNESSNVTYNRTAYYDGSGIEMICDFVLPDKSCLLEINGVIGSELGDDFLPFPDIKEKIVIGDLKIEQKQEGIPLPKSGLVQLRYIVEHPIPFGDMPQIANKYNITVCSTDGSECTTLDPEWWNSSWDYKKEIPIDGTGLSIQDNYQLLINVSHVTDKMNSTFKDLRFTNGSENTLLSYWIEYNASSNYAEIWVKIPAMSNTVNTSIYMYYGNDAALTTRNGDGTFIFFDNASGTIGDKWNTSEGDNTAAFSYASGYIQASWVSGDKMTRLKIVDGHTVPNDMIMDYEQWVSGTNGLPGVMPRYISKDDNYDIWVPSADINSARIFQTVSGSRSEVSSSAGKSVSEDIWHDMEVSAVGTTFKIYANGVLQHTATDSSHTTGKIGLFAYYDSPAVQRWKNVRVREYSANEANINYSFGAEQEPAETTKPTYSNDAHNTTIAGNSIKFSIQYDDTTALHPDGQYIFSTNNTGTWANESAVNFTATPNWANVTKTLNSTASLVIGYRWYADDNAGNINNTGIFSLTTTSATFVDIIPSQALIDGITFNGADPGTNDNAANNNTACSTGTCYNISIDPATTVNIDLYNKATGDLTSGGQTIGMQNMTHQGNQTSSTGDNLIAAGSTSVTLSYALIVDCSNIPESDACHIRYWLDIPTGQNPGSYSSTYKYCSVETGAGSGDCT